MSDIKCDGGPAFPSGQKEWGGTGWKEITEAQHKGLMLRDWFAGQVICGRLGDPSSFYDPENAARWAYRLADAMLKERKK